MSRTGNLFGDAVKRKMRDFPEGLTEFPEGQQLRELAGMPMGPDPMMMPADFNRETNVDDPRTPSVRGQFGFDFGDNDEPSVYDRTAQFQQEGDYPDSPELYSRDEREMRQAILRREARAVKVMQTVKEAGGDVSKLTPEHLGVTPLTYKNLAAQIGTEVAAGAAAGKVASKIGAKATVAAGKEAVEELGEEGVAKLVAQYAKGAKPEQQAKMVKTIMSKGLKGAIPGAMAFGPWGIGVAVGLAALWAAYSLYESGPGKRRDARANTLEAEELRRGGMREELATEQALAGAGRGVDRTMRQRSMGNQLEGAERDRLMNELVGGRMDLLHQIAARRQPSLEDMMMEVRGLQ